MRHLLTAAALLLSAGTARAQDLRDFCAERPGLGTPACVDDKGHLQVEMALGDWTLDRQPDLRTDTILGGDMLLRYGVSDTLELRLGWTGFGHVRERDRTSGDVSRRSGVGDVSLGLKQSLRNPDGSGLSIAAVPFATLPVGRSGIGAGDWGAGLLLPVTYQISDAIQAEFTPEVDAAVDEDGHGRHLAFSGVAGLTYQLRDTLSASLEYQASRDRDPDGHSTQQLAGLSAAWLVRDRLQLDLGSAIGLNHAAPDVQVYFGVSREF